LKKILIIQTAFLGDVILTIPVIEMLHRSYHGSQMDLMVRPEAKNLIETHPALRAGIVFDKYRVHRGIGGLRNIAKQIAQEGYDICITPHRSWRSAYLTFRTRAPVRIGFDRSAWKGAFTRIVTYRSDCHEIQRNLSLLEPLGLKPVLARPAIFPTGEDEKRVREVVALDGNKLIAMAPGSIWPTKRWPVHHYRTLARLLTENGFSVVLIGGKDDMGICDTLSGIGERIQSAAGILSLRQTYFLLSQCAGLITNDSAPLHLGTAAGIPVFAIFGATVPEFGFSPIGERDCVLERKELPCRPCGIHGHKTCPIKTFACMEQLRPSDVWQAVQKRLCVS
jgi:heptosyltransferase-2